MRIDTTEARFWSYVEKGESDMCWNWTGSRVKNGGYGQLSRAHGLSPIRAHRYSWELHNGPIPAGLYVCHRCDNPACVNPNHLFLGTQLENMRDCASKGRDGAHVHPETIMRGESHWSHQKPNLIVRGEKHGMTKLTDAQVDEIRRLVTSGMMQKEVAKQFGVNKSTVWRIVHRIMRRI